MTHHTR